MRAAPATSAAGCGCIPASAAGACIGELSSPEQRLAGVRDAVGSETEPLVTLTHLLRLCRDEHPTLWERMNDRDCRNHVDCLRADLAAVLPAPGTESTLSSDLRRALVAALAPVRDIPAVVVARALAELLDAAFAHTFSASFARRSPYQPRVGDPVPLDRPDLRRITDLPATSPPWRLANRLDETRRVRLAGEWAAQFRVVFDYCLADVLVGLVDRDTVVATCHPNRSVEDFDLPEDGAGRSFPIRPHDPDRQQAAIDRLVAAAVGAGASIVVLPELSVTEPMARSLEHWVRGPDGPRVLVTGSFHAESANDDDNPAGATRRRNRALTWVRGSDRPLVHDKHSPADRPVREDIAPQGWPEVRIYVSADGWHLVMAICRDLLNPQAVHALNEAGANLVLVPAMSETLMAFGGPVAQLVGSEQALVAVANNPAEWSDDDTVVRATRALFGHPAFAQQTRPVSTTDAAPGVALLHVASGTVTWSVDDPAGTDRANRCAGCRSEAAELPPWAERLARRTRHWADETPASTVTVTLRAAAVLVLLSDGPSGPTVLLSERVRDLSDYPGQLVFPGGAADPEDDGPVSTALREAREEVGLSPGEAVVIGRLPAVALPDSGFLVTPVLAWSPSLPVPDRWNPAEVRRVLHVPLADWRRAVRDGSGGASSVQDPPVRCGRMTAAVLDLLASMAGVAGA